MSSGDNMATAITRDRVEATPDQTLLPGLYDDIALNILALVSRSDYQILARLNKKYKSLMRSVDLYRLRRKLGIIEHWILLAVSPMPWEVFDPARQRWMRLPEIPSDYSFTHGDKESLAVGTDLLVFGREVSGFVIWKYNLLTYQWLRNPNMNSPRCLFATGSIGEIAIVAGGCDQMGNIVKSAELYNSELGTWQALPDISEPRKLCAGFFMDGKFYVVGGVSSNEATSSLSYGEEYDFERGTWRKIENMYPNDRVAGAERVTRSPPLVAVVNNQLYSADLATNQVMKYSKGTGTWSAVKMLPVIANAANGWGLAFKGCGRRLLVIGGSNEMNRNCGGTAMVMYSWEPELGDSQDWIVLAVKEGAGNFVYNCAIMGC